MQRIDGRIYAASLTFFSFSALAQSEAQTAGYKAGYRTGQQIGRFIGSALPVMAVAIAVVVAWLAYRAWRKRRNAAGR